MFIGVDSSGCKGGFIASSREEVVEYGRMWWWFRLWPVGGAVRARRGDDSGECQRILGDVFIQDEGMTEKCDWVRWCQPLATSSCAKKRLIGRTLRSRAAAGNNVTSPSARWKEIVSFFFFYIFFLVFHLIWFYSFIHDHHFLFFFFSFLFLWWLLKFVLAWCKWYCFVLVLVWNVCDVDDVFCCFDFGGTVGVGLLAALVAVSAMVGWRPSLGFHDHLQWGGDFEMGTGAGHHENVGRNELPCHW